MLAQQRTHLQSDTKWDNSRIRAAIVTARHHAALWGRRGHRGHADREDLRQDILLAIVERADHYDPRQGGWSTFVGLLARHVVADRVIADSSDRRTTLVPVDLAAWDDDTVLCSATQPDAGDDAVDAARRIDLETLPDDLPTLAREALLLLLTTHGDIAAALRMSGRTSSSFYRSIDELRLWLRAAGLGVSVNPRGKNHDLDR